MKIISLVALLIALLFTGLVYGASVTKSISITTVAGMGCTQATTFLARTSGLSTAQQNAYKTYICGLVTDNVIPNAATMASTGTTPFCGPKLDALWVMATSTATVANLDLCGHTAYTLVPNGSPNFSPSDGYLGVNESTTIYLNTGFNPATAGGDFTQDSAHMAVWSLTNAQSTSIGGAAIGHNDNTTRVSGIFPWYSDSNAWGGINGDFNNGWAIGAVSDSSGYYVVNRTAPTVETLYKGGTSIATNTNGSQSLLSLPIYILARNYGGSASSGAGLRIAMANIGAGLSSGDIASLQTRGCNYLTTVRGSCAAPVQAIPAPAVAAGFTTLAIDYDFTQSNPWSNPNNWLRCHDGSGAANPLLYQDWQGFGSFGMPSCSLISQGTDPFGALALHLHMDKAELVRMGCEPNCGLVNGVVPNVKVQTVDSNSNGNQLPANSYFEVDALVRSSDSSMHDMAIDLWSYMLDSSIEYDGVEWFGGNTGNSTYHNNATNNVFGTNNSVAFDQSAYHKYAWRVTSDGTTDADFCTYLDNAPGSSAPNNCQNTNPSSAQLHTPTPATIQVESGFVFCDNNLGTEACPNSSVDLWVRRIRVWSCAGVNSGASCFSSSPNP